MKERQRPKQPHERSEGPAPQSTEFVTRKYQIAELIKLTFAGHPWYEDLSDEDALSRVDECILKPGFGAFIVIEDDLPIAGLWYDTPSHDELRAERGQEIIDFIKEINSQHELNAIIWARESVVHPTYQGKGLASKLRQDFLNHVAKTSEGNTLVLTRMRDDNGPILSVAKKFGYERTGIRMPSSQKPDVSHEYWYKLVEAESF